MLPCTWHAPMRRWSCVVVAALWAGASAPALTADDEPARPPKHVWKEIGRCQSGAICEASGIVKSRRHEGVFWTHNDSGNKPVLFGIRLDGSVVAQLEVEGVENRDWEDIAIDGKGNLLIGDLGDSYLRFKEHSIIVLPEPDLKPHEARVTPTDIVTFSYPEQRYDCEAMFVHEGKVYLIAKQLVVSALFRLEPLGDGRPNVDQVCALPIRLATGADVSADGRRLAVCSYGRLWVYELPDDMAQLGKVEPQVVTWPFNFQTEGCAFDREDVIIIAESKQIWRITADDIKNGRRFVRPRD